MHKAIKTNTKNIYDQVTWKTFLFSKSGNFFAAFKSCIDKSISEIASFDVDSFSKTDEFKFALKQYSNSSIIHINANDLPEKELRGLIENIRKSQQNNFHYIVVWTKSPWEDLSFGFFNENRINDVRSLSNLIDIRIGNILQTNIQNLKAILEISYLKDNLEKEINKRTEKLQNTNKKLKAALIQNSNNNTKLHHQQIQIEKQNKEIQQRNTELERSFKRSSVQHIKLEKVLRDNESHRKELEKALAEIKEKNEKLILQNEEIKTQSEHIELQHEELQSQRDLAVLQRDKIVTQQEEIVDNIKYASRIQEALFPPMDLIKQLLPAHFIFNSPKDVVSGDFYWVSQNRHKTVVAVGDCTGHGISGAMMSMLGTAFLNEIINKHDVTNAALILEQLRERVISSLHQQINKSFEYSRDGMDISVCIIDILDNTLEYAGANNPVYLFRNNELTEFMPDRMPIGIHEFCEESFSAKSIKIQSNDQLFMFTDGYADQFGGKKGKKLKYRRFKNILSESTSIEMTSRESFLKNKFESWKGDYEQIDDVLVLGFKIV